MNNKETLCPRLDECLTSFLDKTMSEAERQSFAVHIEGCSDCRRAFERAQTLQNRLQAAAYLKPPEDIYRNVLREIRADQNAPSSLFERMGWSTKLVGAFAVIALVVVALRPPKPASVPEVPPAAPPPVVEKSAPPVTVPKTSAPKAPQIPPVVDPNPIAPPPPIAMAPSEPVVNPVLSEENIQLPVLIARSRREWEGLWYSGGSRPNLLEGAWQKQKRWLEEKGVPKVEAPQAYRVKTTDNVRPLAPTRVDFRKEMVIVLPPDTGFSAEITHVVFEPSQIVVFYRSCSSTSSSCGPMVGEPFSYRVVPKSDLPVVFKRGS